MDLVTVYDCVGSALNSLTIPPTVKMAGYSTGHGTVPWSETQWAQHPDAIRIDQSPVNTPADETADVLDMEYLAATLATIPQWVNGAWSSYRAGTRPGQRTPTIYLSRSSLTPVANTLNSAGITSGVNFWLAAPMDPPAAAQLVTTAGGPFPIIGVQFAFLHDHDVSVFSADWLNRVSVKPQTLASNPGTQSGWRFCSKCKCLTFWPEESISACARGGTHDATKSHNYNLDYLS